MAETRVLIVTGDIEAGKAYARALSEIGVAYDIAPSFREMAEMAAETAYNGLVADILTLVRCCKEEKAIAYDSFNLLPVLRVKWDKKERRINFSPLEHCSSTSADAVLRSFVETRCRPVHSRRLRRHKRKETYLNLLVSTEQEFSVETTVKTFTVSLSTGGAFLHTMQTFPESQRLWLRFIDLADQRPIPATVRWSLPWGQSRSIPGVGVIFEELTSEQEAEIRGILKL